MAVEGAPRVPGKRQLRRVGFVVAAVGGSALLASWLVGVDLAPIVTNDSLGYLSRGEQPFSEGLVVQGYRQVGYAVAIWASDVWAAAVGWDRLFSLAFLQRFVFIISVGLVVYVFRWWSVAILIFLLMPTYVVHADLLISEGLLIGLSLAVGACCAGVMLERPWFMRWGTETSLVLVGLVCALAAIKLQYAAMLAPVAGTIYLLYGDRHLTMRRAMLTVAAGAGVVGLLVLGQAYENYRELGVFEPVSEAARAEWYGAWHAIFTVHSENRAREDLSEWFDEGNLYAFLHPLEREEDSYLRRRELLGERVTEMFEAAGTTRLEEHIAAFLGALGGGRTDDVAGLVHIALSHPPGEIDARVEVNQLARNSGVEAVLETVNEGETVGFMSARPLLEVVPHPLRNHGRWVRWMSYLGLISCIGGLLRSGRQRWPAAGALVMIVAVAAALGSAFIDNSRYVLGPVSFLWIVGLAGVVTQFRCVQSRTKVVGSETQEET